MMGVELAIGSLDMTWTTVLWGMTYEQYDEIIDRASFEGISGEEALARAWLSDPDFVRPDDIAFVHTHRIRNMG